MPRYFFTVEGGQYPLRDEVGTVLPGPEEARAQAVTSAGEMLKDLDGRFWANAKWRMHVTDEQGTTVCILTVQGGTEPD